MRSNPRRTRVRIGGIVQGVGFRPFVYRLAREHGLRGFVRNDEAGVHVEAAGPGDEVARFLSRLRDEIPPLAAIDRFEVTELPPRQADDEGTVGGDERTAPEDPASGDGPPTSSFRIIHSGKGARASAEVTPDTTTCADCLREIFDPGDRRYRYPFTNCTNCGPRFTIVRGIPYDRPFTTMAAFDMCDRCRAEYEDPADRRFHAQPNACPACGPEVRLVDASDRSTPGADAIAHAAAALEGGLIVAVKGLGGYHLACDAAREDAVRRLRGRKHREDKPFAIMVPDLEAAGSLVDAGPAERAWLESPQRPIVLAPRTPGADVAEAVAPGHRDLGLMLPYTPLHHLLLADAGIPLVMTSGNVSDEPIAYRDEEALERLSGIADLFLVHDRPIHTRTDDSVLRLVRLSPQRGRENEPADRGTVMIRRSRGFVPVAISLPCESRVTILGCGAHLKNTFCLASGKRARVSHHIGDLENYETLRSFEEGIEHFQALFEVEPAAIAHDLHPDYLSTRYATERAGRAGLPTFAIQHHHAHLAGCLAEHGETGPALGAIFDGTGYGTDGTVWGGELLAGDLGGFERVGHLWPVRLPGGEAAIRQPWRMACAWLSEIGGGVPPIPPRLEEHVPPERWGTVARLALQEGEAVAAPVTTSVGRLFDAVAALCGLHPEVTYEGQAAIALEMAASRAEPDDGGDYPLPLVRDGETGMVFLDARETVRAAASDAADGVPVPRIASRFHRALAGATADALAEVSRRLGLETVVLSGGVYQNALLLEETSRRLAAAAPEVRLRIPERLPPNDGGISYGQVAVAARMLAGP